MKRQRRSVKMYGINTQFCQRLVFVFWYLARLSKIFQLYFVNEILI